MVLYYCIIIIIILLLLYYYCFSLLLVKCFKDLSLAVLAISSRRIHAHERTASAKARTSCGRRKPRAQVRFFYFIFFSASMWRQTCTRARARVHEEGCECRVVVQNTKCVRETSGTEEKAKKEIKDIYIYIYTHIYNTDKYIYFCTFYSSRYRHTRITERRSQFTSTPRVRSIASSLSYHTSLSLSFSLSSILSLFHSPVLCFSFYPLLLSLSFFLFPLHDPRDLSILERNDP